MKKFYFALFALLLFGLISFSEGKPCPERSRPHKTRCNAYYKCTVIDKKKHVWVPAECEEGLIYEHSLGVCVLPGDDWECGQKSMTSQSGKKTNRNKDADLYIIANAEEEDDEDNMINSKFDDGKVEIIIGTDLSDERDDDENGSEELNEGHYDGSGNGAELMKLDGFMQAATNRETEDSMTRKEDKNDETILVIPQMEKKEELQEVLHTIKTKAEIGQPSSNIDPNLTSHLQRLSQLVDGLKKTYQSKGEEKPQYDLKPDQLNAFLAHFNIKNKFNAPDANEKKQETNYPSNNTVEIRKGASNNLNPETKVMLNNNLPKRYINQQSTDGSQNSGGYSNSQIVINRPGGAVLFSLPPDHHFVEHSEYSADNSPKVSEETLKTVLELSKQMIASQNVPKIIPNPAYYGSPIMQPVFLTPHMDSPFSSNYYGDSMGSQSAFSSDFSTQSGKHKRPGKKPHQGKNPTTIIHNNVIPVHVSAAGSGDKDVVDSYGQSLYPPLNGQGERPETSAAYNGGSQLTYDSNKYHTSHTTKRPLSTDSPLYSNSPRPYDFQPTSETFNKYFTPTEHLNENNINQIFQTTDNFGSVNLRRPSSASSSSMNYQQQSYNPNQGNQDNYGSMYSQMENNQIYGNQNTQSLYPNQLQQQSVSQYPDSNTDEFETISYVYGQNEPSQVQSNHQTDMQYSEPPTQSVFSTNANPYRPNAVPQFSSSSSAYSGSSNNNNKYSAVSSPISTATSSSSFAEGAQLVNVGGNFINIDVFRNTILPLLGGNAKASSAFGNVEVITCAAGVRQPNTTDCTRYYVCSKKDGKVLSYSCPPYTGFNAESRICDARTYALCNPDTTMLPNYSVSENKRIQMETLKALQDAKRKQAVQQQQQQQQQQIQAQQMANILEQYKTSSSLSNSNSLNSLISSSSTTNNGEQNMLQSYMQQAAAMASMAHTTARPNINASSSSKKRKYYCKEGDKIADQTSINSYFVCFKNAQGQMKGHKMTCSKSLIFCPKSTMCTLPSKCS